MEPITVGLVCLGIFMLLMVIGVPVGISMGLVGAAGFAYIVSPEAAIGKVALIPYATMIDYGFAVVPAFILMAQVFHVSGFGDKLYDFCEKVLGQFRGGLAMATVLACAVFAAISSTTIATVVTIGVIAIPAMMRRKYHPGLAGGSVAAAGGLGVLIPPSAILILYGLMTQQSIRDLFLAGLVPGVLLGIVYIIIISVQCRLKPDTAPAGKSYSMKEKLHALSGTWEVFALIILSIGGLTLGWFTPTEAGAIGASGAILIALARKKLTWQGFLKSLRDTAANSGMVGLILIGALIFNYFVAVTTIPQRIIDIIGGLSIPPMACILIVTGIYLLLGMFMDSMAMILLTVPFMFPVAVNLGYDPIWFGVYTVMAMEMAVITPPVGMNVFVTAGIMKGQSLETVFKGVMPFLLGQIAVILFMLLFPDVVTYLPSLLR